MRRRKGKFKVNQTILKSTGLDILTKIFHGVIVWHTEFDPMEDIITYYAESEHFDEIEEYEEIPMYRVTFNMVYNTVNFERE